MAYVMLMSIIIKGLSALVEVGIQIIITKAMGVSGYGDYTFYVSLVEFIYYFFFSASIKINTFYLSDGNVSIQNFKSKYFLRFVTPILATICLVFMGWKNYLGAISSLIVLIYYVAYDISSENIARGKQVFALVGEYLVGRVIMIIGLVIFFVMNEVSTLLLLLLYGMQYFAVIGWLKWGENKNFVISKETSVSISKLVDLQKSDIANSVILYFPAFLQYIFVGAFETGFIGIITITRKIINFISGPTSKVFLPEFSKLYKKNDKNELIATYNMIVKVQMSFISVIAVFLVCFPNVFLTIFSPILIMYKNLFSSVAFCLLLISSAGPVTGILQMTGNEKICNINQWVSIGTMVIVWLLFRKNGLFVVYGLCAQAIIEFILKYYTVNKWFGKNMISLKKIIIMWVPILFAKLVVEIFELSNSLIALVATIILISIQSVIICLKDERIRKEINLKAKRKQ